MVDTVGADIVMESSEVMNAVSTMERPPGLYLARHCKTTYNLENRIQGTIDVPLAEVGRAEAQATALKLKALGIERIVCSHLKRGYETAQIYSQHLGAPLHISPRFRELDLGQWEGKTNDELLNDPDCLYRYWLEDPTTVSVPGSSENTVMARQRIVAAVKDVALRYPGETILIIIHKFVRAVLQCALVNGDLKQFRHYIEECTDPVRLPSRQVRKIVGLNV
jgi:broad specificity phosphatase PhoE